MTYRVNVNKNGDVNGVFCSASYEASLVAINGGIEIGRNI